MRPKINDKDFPPSVIPIVKQCWDENPHKRPTFEELVQTLENLDFPPPTTNRPYFIKVEGNFYLN
jgi:hypothetical protein